MGQNGFERWRERFSLSAMADAYAAVFASVDGMPVNFRHSGAVSAPGAGQTPG
jgi:hypothetical protein